MKVYALTRRLATHPSPPARRYAIERDRVFCLLGPNGAGKTTTINCLTGRWPALQASMRVHLQRKRCVPPSLPALLATSLNCVPHTCAGVLPPSGGDALVYGESLSTPGGMDRIRWGQPHRTACFTTPRAPACLQSLAEYSSTPCLPDLAPWAAPLPFLPCRAVIGVCPQFDVLWGELTGQEHLNLYGRIKVSPCSHCGVGKQPSWMLGVLGTAVCWSCPARRMHGTLASRQAAVSHHASRFLPPPAGPAQGGREAPGGRVAGQREADGGSPPAHRGLLGRHAAPAQVSRCPECNAEYFTHWIVHSLNNSVAESFSCRIIQLLNNSVAE